MRKKGHAFEADEHPRGSREVVYPTEVDGKGSPKGRSATFPMHGNSGRNNDLKNADVDVEVLRKNLHRLVGGLGHGGKKELATALGVSQVAVSRWLAGRHRPRKARLSAIARHFGLTPDVDLETFPVYLSEAPVTDNERRTSLRERIEGLDGESMRTLYPALDKLLRR